MAHEVPAKCTHKSSHFGVHPLGRTDGPVRVGLRCTGKKGEAGKRKPQAKPRGIRATCNSLNVVVDLHQVAVCSMPYAWKMTGTQIRLCFAARQLARTHGTYYAAAFLYEQAVPLEFALIFLTYSVDALSCMHVATSYKGSERCEQLLDNRSIVRR